MSLGDVTGTTLLDTKPNLLPSIDEEQSSARQRRAKQHISSLVAVVQVGLPGTVNGHLSVGQRKLHQ